jgi:glutamate synthase domain-containing protein 2
MNLKLEMFALIQAGLRDAVTVVASGGIALAEHMAKIMICGADVAAVDIPVLLANQCRMCMNCREGKPCPVEIDKVEVDWSRQRIVNLLGSWHAQMIEVLGAMGMREARRLRGELGRAMFFKDMERESFGPIFGRRKIL